MGELLDFKDQGNFDFFEFGATCKHDEERKRSFKRKCESVLEYAHATVQDMCLLGFHLKELKESKTWEHVRNTETGYFFAEGEFAAFCEYAFGFSKTKTSDFLRISQFVKISGTKNGFLPEQYHGYNTSQLVELASVKDGVRHYFKPEMPVSEIRLVKQYIDSGALWDDNMAARRNGVKFDALESAKAWKENKGKKEAPAPSLSPDVIPGQVNIEELGEEVFENPTSDLAEACESEISEEKRESVINSILLFSPWRDKKKRIYEKYKENTSMYGFLDFIKEEYRDTGCCTSEGWKMSANSKGFVISCLCAGEPEFFLAWEQIASRIVSLINCGEYYTEDDERIENARKAAHDAGIPFSEKSADEDFDPYVFDGSMSVEDYNLMHEHMQEDKQGFANIENPTSDLAEDCGTEKYSFGARAHVREFLSNFEKWPLRCGCVFFNPSYYYALKNGAFIYAFSYNSFVNVQERTTEKRVTYLLQEKGDLNAVEISKEQFERYCAENKQEL